ncbi:MAG TPA: hypothetical protein VGA84_11190 [Thermoanaerobaculia bacterium]
MDDKDTIIHFARTTRRIIRWSAFVVPFFFVWLRFRGVDVMPVVRSLPATILLRASLVLYYFSWLYGTTFDTDIQELVYHTAPTKQGRVPTTAIVVMLTIAAMFAVLCAITSFQQFLVFLACFWLVDILAWRYLVTRLLPPVFRASLAHFKEVGDDAKIDQLDFVKDYHVGHWKWLRSIVGAVLLLVLNVIARTGIVSWLASRIQMSVDTTLAVAIAMFLLFVEGWVWIMRLRTRFAIQTIEQLRHRYHRPAGA